MLPTTVMSTVRVRVEGTIPSPRRVDPLDLLASLEHALDALARMKYSGIGPEIQIVFIAACLTYTFSRPCQPLFLSTPQPLRPLPQLDLIEIECLRALVCSTHLSPLDLLQSSSTYLSRLHFFHPVSPIWTKTPSSQDLASTTRQHLPKPR